MITRLLRPWLESQRWADRLGAWSRARVLAIFGVLGPVKDLLHGTWLGHPLHPLLTDVPIGALTVALLLDLTGLPGADVVTAIGVAAMVAAALAGVAGYADLEGRSLRYGTLHGLLMTLSLLAYAGSLAVRLGGSGPIPALALSLAGYLLLAAGGFLGGELVFGMGSQVDRHAFRGRDTRWIPLEAPALAPGSPVKARAGSEPVVALLRLDRLVVLHDTCSHQGCSLATGTIEGGAIECPCHGSRFRLTDGAVLRGPAVFDQPVYETRRTESGWEVRPLPRASTRPAAHGRADGTHSATQPGPAASA